MCMPTAPGWRRKSIAISSGAAFVGGESTGKSTLVEHLAERCGTQYVPEIGRYFWKAKLGKLSVQDYVDIAEQHRAAEDEALERAHRFLFVDTNALTTLLRGYAYGQVGEAPPSLLRYANECRTRYDRHYLCGDDIPFTQDGWRTDAGWRARIQREVREDLRVRGIPYVVLNGTLELRTARVLEEEGEGGDCGGREGA
jgi:HTH-type transcriptional repressor of NAD biosynthesis genes